MNLSKLSGIKVGGTFLVTCRRPDGRVRWEDTADNMVVNVGLQHILNTVFSGSAQVTTWYVGLMASSPTVASGNTMASHAGWTEFANYDEAGHQEYVEVRSNQQLTNAASKATFTVSADSSVIGGAFLTSASAKSVTTGTLMCGAAFTGGNKSADKDDTLEVTYTFTAGDDGA